MHLETLDIGKEGKSIFSSTCFWFSLHLELIKKKVKAEAGNTLCDIVCFVFSF